MDLNSLKDYDIGVIIEVEQAFSRDITCYSEELKKVFSNLEYAKYVVNKISAYKKTDDYIKRFNKYINELNN